MLVRAFLPAAALLVCPAALYETISTSESGWAAAETAFGVMVGGELPLRGESLVLLSIRACWALLIAASPAAPGGRGPAPFGDERANIPPKPFLSRLVDRESSEEDDDEAEEEEDKVEQA